MKENVSGCFFLSTV